MDLYALGEDSFGLDTLEPLATRSGGMLHLYPQIEEAALPEVLFIPRQCSTGAVWSACHRNRSGFDKQERLGMPDPGAVLGNTTLAVGIV